MFEELQKINRRPRQFEFYTTPMLWNDKHISKKMLELHLNETVDMASRNKSFIKRSAEWIVSHFNVGKETKICDFGCGPGLYSGRFAEKGAIVTGVDLSERSIQYAQKTAKEKGLNINYILQNYLQFSTDKKFDLITMIYCDFCVLSPEQKKTLLDKFYKFSENNGKILLDVFSINFFDKIKEKQTYEYSENDGFWSPEPYYVFLNTYKYEEEKVFLDKYVIFEKGRRFEIFNWLQFYDIPTLEEEFRENGFRITEYYSNIAGYPYRSDSDEIAIVAEKIP